MNAPSPVCRIAAALWCGCALLPAQAETTLADKVAGQTAVAVAGEERGGVALSMTQDVAPAAALAQPGTTATQSMLWARRQAVAVGIGVEQRTNRVGELHAAAGTQAGPLRQANRLVVGVSLATTERTSIALQAPVWTDARDREREALAAPRMALRGADSLGELRAGLQMKMKMGEQTTLSVRPRSRGVGVTLRSQW